jgi:hypothetical protein
MRRSSVGYYWFGGLALTGLFFILTGRYIQDGYGRRTKVALLAASIAAFPLSFAVLPIYICLQLSNNYTRFKELPDKIQQLFHKPKSWRPRITEVIVLAGVLAAGLASLVLRLDAITAAARQPSQAPVQSAPVVNTAARDKFTIIFPGSVSVSDLTKQISGHAVSYTSYASTAGKGKGDFWVYAYNFPAPLFTYATMPAAALAPVIHQSVVTLVQGLPGTLTSSNPSTYTGYPAEDVAFTCQTYAGTSTGYGRVLFAGNYEYAIFAIGSSRQAFYGFANSFHFRD